MMRLPGFTKLWPRKIDKDATGGMVQSAFYYDICVLKTLSLNGTWLFLR